MADNRLGDACALHLADALQNSVGLLASLGMSNCDFGEEAGKVLGPAIGMMMLWLTSGVCA